MAIDCEPVEAVVFDIGRVLVQWDLRCLFAKLIDDREELNWFLDNVVTEQWHFQHDAGRPLDEMVRARSRPMPPVSMKPCRAQCRVRSN
jgi:2-haloacid dehalogenase